MSEGIDDALRELHEYISAEAFAEELARAKTEFFKKVGAPLPGEPIEELRLSSFVEWFIFDRPLDEPKLTPVEKFMRERAESLTAERVEVLRGFTAGVHGVFLVKKRKGRSADLLELYSKKKYKGVRRVPPSLGKGDLAELRLIGVGGEYFATDALCFHPWSATKDIKRALKKANKEGRDVLEAVLELMAKNTRYERYPKTAKARAYSDE